MKLNAILVGLGLLILGGVGYLAVLDYGADMAYRSTLGNAKIDCRAKGGDEIRPYGFTSWLQVFSDRPTKWSCRRFGKYLTRNIAIYTIQWDGQKFALEIR